MITNLMHFKVFNFMCVIGLFANGHMPYDKDRQLGPTGHPSLSDMVSKAIDVLNRNENGFTLIVRLFKIHK